MSVNRKRLQTRVFRAGNSQAVRIPKAFELPEGEAIIERRSGGLFIKRKHGSWTEFFDKPPLAYLPHDRDSRLEDLPHLAVISPFDCSTARMFRSCYRKPCFEAC